MEAKAASGGDDSPKHERGYFDAPFGVRFGLLVDTEVNFGAPTLSLMRAGCGDIVYLACALNPPFYDYGGQLPVRSGYPALGGLTALAFQSAFSVGHGVNLLAANGHYGSVVTGSGLWPGDSEQPAVQHYESRYPRHDASHYEGSGWLGVHDLVSRTAPPPPPSVPTVLSAAALGEVGTINAVWFDATDLGSVADGTMRVAVAAGDVSCELNIARSTRASSSRNSSSASYALVAGAGLSPFGFYTVRQQPWGTSGSDRLLLPGFPAR